MTGGGTAGLCTFDLYGHLVPGRLDNLRTTFDAAVSADRATTGTVAHPGSHWRPGGYAW